MGRINTRTELTSDTVALVLEAVAMVEGWDGVHTAVKFTDDGRTIPSRALLRKIRELQVSRYGSSNLIVRAAKHRMPEANR